MRKKVKTMKMSKEELATKRVIYKRYREKHPDYNSNAYNKEYQEEVRSSAILNNKRWTEEEEKQAFLCTSKANAAKLFSKHLV